MMNSMIKSINDLPDAIIEYIFCLLSPYNELYNCKFVCRKWYFLTSSAINLIKNDFKKSIKKFNIEWNEYTTNNWPNISGRYLHSSCLHSQYMYIFGGLTNGYTTFNDLWMFDLNNKIWSRPLIFGSYPPPKACASLVSYKNNLILFGGKTQSSPFPSRPDWKLFGDLHKLDLLNKKWKIIKTNSIKCPPMAHHSASIINDKMIVYGGLYSQGKEINSICINTDIWIFDFISNQWFKKTIISNEIPNPRYGHSQIVLDEKHIIITGGCGKHTIFYNDVWLLVMDDIKDWYWKRIEIETNDTIQTPIFGFNPVVKIDDMMVFLSKKINLDLKIQNSNLTEKNFGKICRKNITKNINFFQPQQYQNQKNAEFSNPYLSYSTLINKTRSNFLIKKHDGKLSKNNIIDKETFKNFITSTMITLNTTKNQYPFKAQNPMYLYVLDISKILNEFKITWINHLREYDGPSELMLYTLVAATNELVIFGGIKRCLTNNEFGKNIDVDSNSTYVLSTKKKII